MKTALAAEAAALMAVLLEMGETPINRYDAVERNAASDLIKAARLLLSGDGCRDVADALNDAIFGMQEAFYEVGHLVPLVERYCQVAEEFRSSATDW